LSSFALKIVTPDGLRYEGLAEGITLRTSSGDMGILPGHINVVAPLGMGQATVVIDGKKRYAACIGGMISVVDNQVRIVATAFEWADQIDASRAAASEQRAKQVLADKNASATELTMAEARLKRALIRQSVAGGK
jgi:F-type H+-transporting ATPase subunit epsilon